MRSAAKNMQAQVAKPIAPEHPLKGLLVAHGLRQVRVQHLLRSGRDMQQAAWLQCAHCVQTWLRGQGHSIFCAQSKRGATTPCLPAPPSTRLLPTNGSQTALTATAPCLHLRVLHHLAAPTCCPHPPSQNLEWIPKQTSWLACISGFFSISSIVPAMPPPAAAPAPAAAPPAGGGGMVKGGGGMPPGGGGGGLLLAAPVAPVAAAAGSAVLALLLLLLLLPELLPTSTKELRFLGFSAAGALLLALLVSAAGAAGAAGAAAAAAAAGAAGVAVVSKTGGLGKLLGKPLAEPAPKGLAPPAAPKGLAPPAAPKGLAPAPKGFAPGAPKGLAPPA